MSQIQESFDEFLEAASVGDRIDAFAHLVRALRRKVGPGEGRSRMDALFQILDGSPELKARFSEAWNALLFDTHGTSLLGDTGIPSERGFLAELGDRLSARLVPTPRDDRDLSNLLRRLFKEDSDVAWLRGLSLADFDRFATFTAAAISPSVLTGLRQDFADGFRLLLARIRAQGLSRKLRPRSRPQRVSESPFFRAGRSGEALIEAWEANQDLSAPAAAFRRDSAQCRKELRTITRHLEESGVSVDIVFGLEVIDRCLTRTALMADVVASPVAVERTRALYRLLIKLAEFAHRDRSVIHLVRWNLHLLDRKIVDRSGQTGEHYVAWSLREYRLIWLAAAGGGALTVLTAAVKMKIHEWHLAAFPEGFLYGLNYAISFLLLQAFGLILATKQPAMTAAALANIMREAKGDDREVRIASFFTRLTSSQLAAAISNVLSVGIGCSVFVFVFQEIAGRPYLDAAVARDTFETLSPVNSGTVFFAALTGVLLWLGSLAGGWFENWATYHRVPEGLAQLRFGKVVGRYRMEKFAASFAHNASGWATNVALGFLLGFAPAIGRFFGIPFDVRHVTLSTGTLALAAASLGENWLGGGYFLLALAGIGVMFVLNLSVAFSLSLFNAARAYELTNQEIRGVLHEVLTGVLKRPLDLIRPPAIEPGRPAAE
jgi:site-specific recombinase